MAFTGSHYGKPNKTIHAGNVRCEGDEENLEQCSMTEYALEKGKQLLQGTDVAGVSCVVPPPPPTTTTPAISSVSTATSHSGTSPLIVAILAVVCIIFIVVLICAV